MTAGTLSYLHESIGGHLLLLQTIAESQVFPNCFYCQNGSKKYLLILRCLHSIALNIHEMLACIVVWSYVNFHAITMDRYFLMITVSPIKSCFEIRSTLANFERSKSPEDFHTIGTARLQCLINDAPISQHSIQSSNYAHFVPMLIYEKDKFVSILSALASLLQLQIKFLWCNSREFK